MKIPPNPLFESLIPKNYVNQHHHHHHHHHHQPSSSASWDESDKTTNSTLFLHGRTSFSLSLHTVSKVRGPRSDLGLCSASPGAPGNSIRSIHETAFSRICWSLLSPCQAFALDFWALGCIIYLVFPALRFGLCLLTVSL